MYKWMEGVAAVYAITKDPELDQIMDTFIEQVVKAQREDGYIHTPVIIDERNKGIDTHSNQPQQAIGTKVGGADEKGAFANRLNFETYNLGHLMMAGITHYRATGKRTLFGLPSRPRISSATSTRRPGRVGPQRHLPLALYGRDGDVSRYG